MRRVIVGVSLTILLLAALGLQNAASQLSTPTPDLRIPTIQHQVATMWAYLFATPTQEVVPSTSTTIPLRTATPPNTPTRTPTSTFTVTASRTATPTLTLVPTITFVPDECYQVIVDTLNIRSEPRTTATRVGTLKRGDKILIVDLASQQTDNNTIFYFFAFMREGVKVWSANSLIKIVGEDVRYMEAC